MYDPLHILCVRAEARAILYGAGEFDLYEAIAPLVEYANAECVDSASAQAIIRSAFPNEDVHFAGG